MVTLRDYQTEIIDQTRSLMRSGVHSVLVSAPTGSGKTLLTAWMLKQAADRGLSSWFVVHRRELVRQSVLAFDAVSLEHGIVSAGFPENRRALVQIASVQSLARRRHKVRTPKLIVFDEAHHLAAGAWSRLAESAPDAFRIGLTATPERLDGKGLSTWFAAMVEGPSVQSLIEQGFLSQYRLYAPPGIQVTGLHTRMGDYAKEELASAADKPTITGDAIAHYHQHAEGKRAVVFCVSREHSRHVVSQFAAAGIPAEHVDGETPMAERDAAVWRFSMGHTRILSNVELFGEGFDLPAIEAAILLRPTQSLGLYLQQIGRALRPSPGKETAMILDHAGNCLRHGLPDDPREWSLEGRAGRQQVGEAKVAVRLCPSCFAAQPPGSQLCRFCGFVFEIQSREVERVEGELAEVNLTAMRRVRRTEQGRAESFDDLLRLGKQRGYKNPYGWAKVIANARQARKLAQGRMV